MLEALLISNIVLWISVIGLGVIVMALARQVGLLHERSAPLGAMMADAGPDVGDKAPTFEVNDFSGRLVKIGSSDDESDPDGRDTLLVFLAPACPMCNKLLPTIRALRHSEHLNVMVVSDGEEAEHKRFLSRHHIDDIPYVVSAEIGMRFRVGRVPHAVLIDDQGVIRAKGLVNTREHLESLLQAKEMNHASIQDYLRKSRDEQERVASAPAQ